MNRLVLGMAIGYPMLKVKNLAQIKEGEVEFGDFTLLVGPHTSGKSILLQMLKLVVDRSHITTVLKTNGYDWGRDPSKLFELVFGEGMQSIWNTETKVNFDGKEFYSDSFLPKVNEISTNGYFT
jgi:energy-coupling factor transporter ATP-binding protein EcfA2